MTTQHKINLLKITNNLLSDAKEGAEFIAFVLATRPSMVEAFCAFKMAPNENMVEVGGFTYRGAIGGPPSAPNNISKYTILKTLYNQIQLRHLDKVPAIREFRIATNTSLLEAKAIVEQIRGELV